MASLPDISLATLSLLCMRNTISPADRWAKNPAGSLNRCHQNRQEDVRAIFVSIFIR